jgi:hypothetical protein
LKKIHLHFHRIHRRGACAGIALAIIAMGLLWRSALLHLPFPLWKYGGSALWAAAVYWLVAVFLPSARSVAIAAVAGLFALVVELTRLIHFPAFDAFRQSFAGQLTLGRIFSLRNILAYWVAIALAAWFDTLKRPGRRHGLAPRFAPPRRSNHPR